VSAVLEYHRATNVAADGTDEDEERMVDARPSPFKDYADTERLALEASVAGPLLQAASLISTAHRSSRWVWLGCRAVCGGRCRSSHGARRSLIRLRPHSLPGVQGPGLDAATETSAS